MVVVVVAVVVVVVVVVVVATVVVATLDISEIQNPDSSRLWQLWMPEEDVPHADSALRAGPSRKAWYFSG